MQEIDAETVTASVADAPPAEAPAPNRRGAFVATGAMVGTGIVLGAAFFPLMFDRWMNYDDGGMFSVSLKVLLHNGSLYDTVWADKYGPFYYLVMTTLYRVMHQEPTVANGRWIVLVLTVGSAGIFGVAVWRVTGSIPASVVCEVAAFLILIEGAANEPMHPGALGVLLIVVVVFELAAYAIRPTHWHLFVVGAASGASLMTKLNVGLLVVVAIVVAFSVGNALVPRSLRLTITVLAAATPFVLILQSLASIREAELAFVVGIAVIGTAIVMSIDELVIPPRSLAWAIAGVGVALLGSLAFAIGDGNVVVGGLHRGRRAAPRSGGPAHGGAEGRDHLDRVPLDARRHRGRVRVRVATARFDPPLGAVDQRGAGGVRPVAPRGGRDDRGAATMRPPSGCPHLRSCRPRPSVVVPGGRRALRCGRSWCSRRCRCSSPTRWPGHRCCGAPSR